MGIVDGGKGETRGAKCSMLLCLLFTWNGLGQGGTEGQDRGDGRKHLREEEKHQDAEIRDKKLIMEWRAEGEGISEESGLGPYILQRARKD